MDPDTSTSTYHEKPVRACDAYVFCLLGSLESTEPNPLDIDQWTFHVIGTKDLDSEVGTQKSIGIHPLKKLVERLTGHCEVGYDDLSSVIKSML